MHPLINIILLILTVLLFTACGYMGMLKNNILSKEIENIKKSFKFNNGVRVDTNFTKFLASRTLSWWLFVIHELTSKSMVISLLIIIIQWGNSLRAEKPVEELLKFFENPGYLFYLQFIFLLFVVTNLAVIQHSLALYKLRCQADYVQPGA